MSSCWPLIFVYLIFRSISVTWNCLILKVTEMKAEYFPPREDVILQNEAPTDLYILVTGAVVIN
jgi:CRP-like cAMP-binding protein